MEGKKEKNILSKKEDNKVPVKWTGNYNSATGISEDLRTLIKGLSCNDYKVCISNTGNGNNKNISKDFLKIFTEFQNNPLEERYIEIQNTIPGCFSNNEESYYNIGRTFFEAHMVPKEDVKHCNEMDEIWVSTKFNAEAFIRSGVAKEKIWILPGAIDTDIFNTNVRPLEIEGKKEFNLLSIFDWRYGKGWDVLLEGFIKEFSADDDIALIVKTYPFNLTKLTFKDIEDQVSEFIKKIAGKNKKIPKITFIKEILTQEEMVRLYKACDCFVLPTRGEGWGRPFMEAMLMGLPVIGTNWSGHLDFMDDKNSFLINCKIVNIPPEGFNELGVYKNNKWAEPSIYHLRSLMRYVFKNREEGIKKGQIARDFVINTYNARNISKKAINRLDEVKDWDKKKFKLLIDEEKRNDFIDWWGGINGSEIFEDNIYFEIDYFSSIEELGERDDLTKNMGIIDIHINKFNDLNSRFHTHSILLLDEQSESLDKAGKGETKEIIDLKYRVDDIWVKSEKSRETLINAGISENSIYLIDERFNAFEDLIDLKSRMVKIKRRPIKRYLEDNHINNIKNRPGFIENIKRDSYLAFVDPGDINDFGSVIGDFINKFAGNKYIAFIISTCPGKAKIIFKYIEELIIRNNIDPDSIPDIVIFDEVMGRDEIIRLVYQIDHYLSFDSSLNNEFMESAARLGKEIIDSFYRDKKVFAIRGTSERQVVQL